MMTTITICKTYLVTEEIELDQSAEELAELSNSELETLIQFKQYANCSDTFAQHDATYAYANDSDETIYEI